METSLTAEDLRSRLKLDYQVATQMKSPLMKVEAYRNVDDLEARQDAIVSIEEGHLATHYRVEYNIKTLIARGRYSNRTVVHFDLFANNDDYPFAEPGGFVIESEMPWSPHFLHGHPICIGQNWGHAKGNMLLGQLLVHIAKLLNFDEPPYEIPNYVGYNGEAIEYWETELHREPLTKNLRYPVLPDLVLPPTEAEQPPARKFERKRVTGTPSPAIKRRSVGQGTVRPSRIRVRTVEHNLE